MASPVALDVGRDAGHAYQIHAKSGTPSSWSQTGDGVQLKKSMSTLHLQAELVVTATPGSEHLLGVFESRWMHQVRLFAAALENAAQSLHQQPPRSGLDNMDGTRFLVSATGRLIEASPSGRRNLEAGGSILLGSDGRLKLRDRAKTQELNRFLLALASDPLSGPFALRVDGPSGDGWDGDDEPTCSAWLIVSLLQSAPPQGTSEDVRILLRLKTIERTWTVPERFIAQALGLTSAEAQLVAALVSGSSIKEYAEAIGRRQNTIRWHMANILGKTGCRSQREVVQLVLKLLIE
ncbi:MAG: LuxR C-terminal-related transcriptional regulator [Hyphomicrobiaceae bacterium]